MGVFLLNIFFLSCKKESSPIEKYECVSCIQSAEALSINDQSSAGVYKSVLLGSSGSLSIYVYNGNENVTATVIFDNKSGTLTTQDLTDWTPGQPINEALFTGTVDGKNVTALFSVHANGENPTVNCSITGHDITIATYKELSSEAIKVYEGSYSGSENGGLNILMNGNEYTVIVKGGILIETSLVDGRIEFTAANSNKTYVVGNFSTPDQLSGEWEEKDGDKGKGSWKALRTL